MTLLLVLLIILYLSIRPIVWIAHSIAEYFKGK